ncbi:MAG TPA: hypothetical protein VLJ21_02785 [Candidatus Binatia bacterium]|nr:hypothetical protein [Candidatus Binatia bacterium]
MTDPLDLVRAVRKVVRTGLVLDIPWLPNYQKLAEDDVYVNPKDFVEHAFDRIRHLDYAAKQITEGAEKIPGTGTIEERVRSAEKGLQWCRDNGYSFATNFLNDVQLTPQEIPADFRSKTGNERNGLSFTNADLIASYVTMAHEGIPAHERCIQDAAHFVLANADKLFYWRRRWSSKSGYELLIDRRTKELLERTVLQPGNLLYTPQAAGGLLSVAEHPNEYLRPSASQS